LRFFAGALRVLLWGVGPRIYRPALRLIPSPAAVGRNAPCCLVIPPPRQAPPGSTSCRRPAHSVAAPLVFLNRSLFLFFFVFSSPVFAAWPVIVQRLVGDCQANGWLNRRTLRARLGRVQCFPGLIANFRPSPQRQSSELSLTGTPGHVHQIAGYPCHAPNGKQSNQGSVDQIRARPMGNGAKPCG